MEKQKILIKKLAEALQPFAEMEPVARSKKNIVLPEDVKRAQAAYAEFKALE